MNTRNLGHWAVLLAVILGIGGVVYGMHSIDAKDEQEVTKANKANAKQTKQEIAYDALKSRQQRTHRKTSFDKKQVMVAPQFTKKLTRELKAKKFSGSALVVKNDYVVYQRSFGEANAKKKRVNKVTSQFLINSLQKSLTGMLVMQAVQEGKLQLTDRLSQYYPSIQHSGRVTLRQMLNMEAGLTGEMAPTTTLNEAGVYKYAEQTAKINPKRINTFDYQPISYVLLAGILHQVTHESYYKLFYQRLVTPLNLNHTSFAQLRSKTKGMTVGYSGTTPGDFSTPKLPSMRDMEAQIATGNVTMSTGDMFRAERAIIQGKLLTSKAGANVLHEAANKNAYYAGGMYHLDRIGYYGHGVGDFYEGTFVMSRDGKTGVVFLSNNFYKKSMWPDWSTEDLAISTFRHVLAAPQLK